MEKTKQQLIEAFEAFSRGTLPESDFFSVVEKWASSRVETRMPELKTPSQRNADSIQTFSPAGANSQDVSQFSMREPPTQSFQVNSYPEVDIGLKPGDPPGEGEVTSGMANSDTPGGHLDDSFDELVDTPISFINQSADTNENHRIDIAHDDSQLAGSKGPQDHRFEFIRPHAKGGLGKVSVALDTELNREVALKEIRSRYVDNQNSKTRFNIEALITGSLEHPGVVPVYGYGNNQDGSPWFAMRFIKGDTFRSAITEWHDSFNSVNESSESRLAFRSLLARFIDACHAIAYANNRGVLHRDIKPSNIMLGKYGETLVVDWGLAKKIDRTNPADPVTAQEASIIIDSKDTASTMDGSTLGTPAFMSPEQAAGRLDSMGPASDVFSLGATLYYIVAGRLAFDGSTAMELVDNARLCNFQPPIEHKPGLAKPLNAICCRAMAAKPADRYESAMDLAADIESWLADEPVLAYEESFVERAFRWLRRHKMLAVSTGVLALAVASFSLIGMMLVNAEKNRTVEALEQVQMEKTKTDQALSKLEVAQTETVSALEAETAARRQTRNVLNTVTDDLVGELLARQIELGEADRIFFERVLSQFSEFTKTEGDSNDAVNIRADGFFRVANLQRRLDDLAAAEEGYLKAETMFASLVERDPQPQFRVDQAAVNANLAVLYASQGKHRAAIEKEDRGISLLTGLVSEFPENAQYNLELAKIRINRANAFTRLGEFEKAESDFRASVDLMKKLVEANGRNKLKGQYATALTSLANFYSKQKESIGDSSKLYQQAIEILDATATDDETAIVHRQKQESQLAFARQNYGNVLLRQKQNDAAIEQFRAAIETQTELTNRYPSLATYRRDLGRSKLGLSRALNRLELDGAEQSLNEANKIILGLVEQFPERIDFKQDHAMANEQLASIYKSEKDIAAATKHYRQSIKIRAEISKLRPENDRLARQAVGAQINFANFLRTSKEYPEATVRYKDLLELLEGEEEYDKALLRLVRFGLADCFKQQKKYSDAWPLWTKLTENHADPAWKAFELQRAMCEIREGNIMEGVSAAKSVLEMEDPDEAVYYDVASCYSIAAASEKDKDKSSEYAAQALDLLRQIRDDGLFSEEIRAHAADDPDLDGIRSLEAFKEFFESLSSEQ